MLIWLYSCRKWRREKSASIFTVHSVRYIFLNWLNRGMNEWMNFIQKVPGWHSSICTPCYINRECFCWWNTGEKLLVALTAPSCYRKVPTGKTQQKALWGDSHSYLCCQWGLAESACFWTRMFGSVFGESGAGLELAGDVWSVIYDCTPRVWISDTGFSKIPSRTLVNFFRWH